MFIFIKKDCSTATARRVAHCPRTRITLLAKKGLHLPHHHDARHTKAPRQSPLPSHFFVIGFAPAKTGQLFFNAEKTMTGAPSQWLRGLHVISPIRTQITHSFIHRRHVAIGVLNALSCTLSRTQTLHVGVEAKNQTQVAERFQAFFAHSKVEQQRPLPPTGLTQMADTATS